MTLFFSPADADVDAQLVNPRDLVNTGKITKNRIKEISKPTGFYRRFGKRLFDTFLTLLAAPIIVPVVVLAAILIALDGHNPFYSQLRVGAGGKTFRMWKLRSMVHNADALLETYLMSNPEARIEWESTQKLKNDPRITTLGRILRKTSLDELPQLFNVLNGTMSLVGPRPMMLCQRASYSGVSYYNLKPGITGFWQISDRNECNFIDRVLFDNEYDKAATLRKDIWVLAKTVGVVLRGTGY